MGAQVNWLEKTDDFRAMLVRREELVAELASIDAAIETVRGALPPVNGAPAEPAKRRGRKPKAPAA